MKRIFTTARTDWAEKVSSVGLTYHTHENGPYWIENAYYEFKPSEIDLIEKATNELHEMCITAAYHVVDNGLWDRVGIPSSAIPAIMASWERDDPTLYGRFDLAYDGTGNPKLLEYNADTPTALVEAALAQWFWKEEMQPEADQFNSLHESLIAAWKTLSPRTIHFAGIDGVLEDVQTISYLMDLAQQAGHRTRWTPMAKILLRGETRTFHDPNDQAQITDLFKLYPWEHLFHEEFAPYIKDCGTNFIEPGWKLLLSNKGLLPILWEIFPDHPFLLPSFTTPDPLGGDYVKKPIFSREGANVSIVRGGKVVAEEGGDYGEEGFIYQALAPIPNCSGFHPVIGSWMVNQESHGMGIREDQRLITGNLSRFVPHIFR